MSLKQEDDGDRTKELTEIKDKLTNRSWLAVNRKKFFFQSSPNRMSDNRLKRAENSNCKIPNKQIKYFSENKQTKNRKKIKCRSFPIETFLKVKNTYLQEFIYQTRTDGRENLRPKRKTLMKRGKHSLFI